MEFYQEILLRALENEAMTVSFPNLTVDAAELVHLRSYQALKQIQEILADDQLDDPACCRKIEEILCVLEEIGGSGGNRHDFG